MTTVFLYCAAIGGGLLVLQFLLLVCGIGGDGADGLDHAGVHFDTGDLGGHDLGHDVGHDQSSFLKLLSLQTLTGFATFFGLVGMTGTASEWSQTATLSAAVLAGIAAVWLVGKSMQLISRLQSSGTLDFANAIGHEGRVYLHIPAASAGHGRIMVEIQGRNVECKATTRGTELHNGALVRVVAVRDEVLEVEALERAAR